MFTFAEYNHAAARTETYTVTDWRQNIPIPLYRTLHGILGLSSEITEFQIALRHLPLEETEPSTNIIEELGDLWWYGALLARATMLQGHANLHYEPLKHALSRTPVLVNLAILVDLVGEGADLCKRTLFYGKPLDVTQIKAAEILTQLHSLTTFCSANLEEVWKVNITKLWVRFPDRFSGELAINRNTHTELEAMVAERLEQKRLKEAAAKATQG